LNSNSPETFKVNCCGVDTQLCDVFAEVDSSRRKRLLQICQSEIDAEMDAVADAITGSVTDTTWTAGETTVLSCFSPMSTVIEQTKGRMLLKDLKFGDSVLAANQVFQPFVLDNTLIPPSLPSFFKSTLRYLTMIPRLLRLNSPLAT